MKNNIMTKEEIIKFIEDEPEYPQASDILESIVFQELARRATPEDLLWLIRTTVKEVKQSMIKRLN